MKRQRSIFTIDKTRDACIDGGKAENGKDNERNIHKYAIPTLASDNTEGQGTWTTRNYSYESFMSVMKKFFNGKMTAAEFAAKWDQMTGAAE